MHLVASSFFVSGFITYTVYLFIVLSFSFSHVGFSFFLVGVISFLLSLSLCVVDYAIYSFPPIIFFFPFPHMRQGGGQGSPTLSELV